VLGGFRFKGTQAEAEKVIAPWRTRLQENSAAAKHETVTYEGHSIDVTSQGAISVATVYDGNWFFAANDLPSLKTLLDRADKRLNDAVTTLTAEDNFASAFKHMPANYAVFGYARLDTYMRKLADRFPHDADKSEPLSRLRQIRSISAATAFTNGKMRDVLFVAMPKLDEHGELTRSSLSLATKECFLYVANLLNFPKQLDLPDASAAGPAGIGGGWKNFLGMFGKNGITREDWDSAFASELGVVGDWPADTRLPELFAAVAVKDPAKAHEILGALMAAAPDANSWTVSERDGVQFYSQPATNPMVPVSATIALSPRLLVAGLNPASVDAAIKRTDASSELARADTFKTAEKSVGTPKESFVYFDSALFYNRLDAALRPMLIMAAAFVPGIAETVDLGILPAAEIITRHLSPLTMSQSYQGDGYVTESYGPVSIYPAAFGALVASGAGTAFYQRQIQNTLAPSTAATPAPSPVLPSPTPDDTP
jgi:hypothetical protein